MWVWAPDAPPMDLRFYHDGLGMDTHEKQIKGGLEITYEDYEPGFGTPMGVARTSELMLVDAAGHAVRERFAAAGSSSCESPPSWLPTPQTSFDSGVFGHSFSLPSQTPPEHAQLEQQLDWMFDFYRGQQDQHGWYGFWNYGDVMHTYDFDRHEWRYDIGGFAWDNSELVDRPVAVAAFPAHGPRRHVPLRRSHDAPHGRSRRASPRPVRAARLAPQRHALGLLGQTTAHQHRAEPPLLLLPHRATNASAISCASRTKRRARCAPCSRRANCRDARERQVDDPDGDFALLGFGTDWGSLAGAWLTEWERTRDPKMRDRLVASMRSIAAQPAASSPAASA